MKASTALAGVALAVLVLAGAAPASAQDLVCFGTLSRGIVCLNGGKIEHHTRESAKLPSNGVSGLVACGDRIVATMGGAIVTYDGKAWSAPNRPPGSYASRLACAGPGKYWVTISGGVAHWDGAGWKAYPIKDIVGDSGVAVFDIAAAPDGSAWVALANGVAARFADGAWTVFKEGQGFDKRYPFTRIYTDAKGQAWLPVGSAVLMFREGKWQPVLNMTSFSAIAFGPDARLYTASGAKLTSIDGDRRAETDLGAAAHGLAVDAAGVVWIASEFGIARFADGKVDARHMHDSALPDNDFSAVAALGKGSPLPPTAEQPAGSLVGRLEWTDGQPVAGAEMQICGVGGALFSGPEGPCGKRPLFLSTKTDAEGKFQFPKALPAAYRLAVKPVGSPRWIVFLGSSDRLRVGPGEAKNSGTLNLDIRNRPK